jgi:gluconolactonase
MESEQSFRSENFLPLLCHFGVPSMNHHAANQQSESVKPASVVDNPLARRKFLAAGAATLTAARMVSADEYGADAAPVRYPDHRLVSLDDRGKKLMLGNTPIQRLYHSKQMLWAEGPAWNAVGRYLIWSDIPNNIQHDGWKKTVMSVCFVTLQTTATATRLTYQGRQISFEHLTRSVAIYDHDGTRRVLASTFEGKSLNGPNDGVAHPNGDIWFTDPGYGGLMDYEGALADTGSVQPYQKEAIYRIEASTGKLFRDADDIAKPNGLCFSPDFKKALRAADTGASHYPGTRKAIRVWDVVDGRKLANGREFASMELQLKGQTKLLALQTESVPISREISGPVPAGSGHGYDGVHVFAGEDGVRIGQILLPEICSNVCFGGTKRNRLFMTGSQSLYAVYVNTKGAHFC